MVEKHDKQHPPAHLLLTMESPDLELLTHVITVTVNTMCWRISDMT